VLIRKFTLLFFFLSVLLTTKAQRANIWYFGGNAGLDFNAGSPPTALTNGQLSTSEGCASLCDTSGKLMFYTDGISVWNKQHAVMQNGSGLNGDPSATQSGIIVPWPGKDHLYYIFTADAYENQGQKGYNYSVVDMTLDNGLGGVTVKNVNLYSPSTEKITVAKHSSGSSWWLITKEKLGGKFITYLITEAGIDTAHPVISDGADDPGPDNAIIGMLHASPDNSKVALASELHNLVEIFEFNNATGKLSNKVPLISLVLTGLSFHQIPGFYMFQLIKSENFGNTTLVNIPNKT
jgi:hypothetical protein